MTKLTNYGSSEATKTKHRGAATTNACSTLYLIYLFFLNGGLYSACKTVPVFMVAITLQEEGQSFLLNPPNSFLSVEALKTHITQITLKNVIYTSAVFAIQVLTMTGKQMSGTGGILENVSGSSESSKDL